MRESRGHSPPQTAEEDKGTSGSLCAPPTCRFGKDPTSTEDTAVGIATSGKGLNYIPKSRRGFGNLGSLSQGPGFANCKDVYLLLSQSVLCSSKTKTESTYSETSSCSPHLVFLIEPSTLCLK